MIIDCRTHLWTNMAQLGDMLSNQLKKHGAPGWTATVADPEAHDRSTKLIDVTFVHGLHAEIIHADVPTELIVDFCRRKPDKRLPVAGIDPLSKNSISRLKDAIELGTIAITLSPSLAQFHPTNSSAMQLYAVCQEYNLPVFFFNDLPLVSSSVMEYARPSLLDEVAIEFPNLKIILTSGGYPWIDETMTLCQKHENVFCDIGGTIKHPWHRYQTLISAHALNVIDKLIFGSGFPQEEPETAIESIYSTNTIVQGVPMPVIPRKSIKSIIEADLFKKLGIKKSVLGINDLKETNTTRWASSKKASF